VSDIRVRLLFVDEGSYHHEVIRIPEDALDGYDRLIDALREEPSVLARTWVDVSRLCAAYRMEEDATD